MKVKKPKHPLQFGVNPIKDEKVTAMIFKEKATDLIQQNVGEASNDFGSLRGKEGIVLHTTQVSPRNSTNKHHTGYIIGKSS